MQQPGADTSAHRESVPGAFGHFRDVRREFPRAGQEPLVAIASVSFDLRPRTLVTLLGPSGCGKTTFLKIVGGLIRASSGVVQINGIDVTAPQPDFGIAFQQSNLMPWRSVLKNVLFPMEIRHENNRAALERALELLALVDLKGFEQSYPSQLSGGMQQRVALCRALIHRPKLLLMDEPFGALDELTRMEMQDLLLDIRAKTNATVVFVTHSISEAIYLSDVVVVFSKRPAVIADYIEVALPYPRTPEIHTMTWRKLHRALYPLAGVAVILIAWQTYTQAFGVSRMVMPSPSDIFWASVSRYDLLLRETWPTLLESVYGFGLAVVIGIPLAVCVANSRTLNLALYPILVAMQSVPKVAIAPIILVWFGLGMESKLAIAFLVAFFPIVVDTATGLRSTPAGLLELAYSLRASPLQVFAKVQFPAALPFIFSGAKVAVTLAVIGAVIGEFVGSVGGLGNLLLTANSQLDSPLAWAALVWLSILGVLLFGAVALAERLLMPWSDAGHA
jgi:ABC-type nitrate/sulfonate/bicarbonate transport system ATPase subunit/ABC-type nitrate/sulfonate/bicarbonate transport system permease component